MIYADERSVIKMIHAYERSETYTYECSVIKMIHAYERSEIQIIFGYLPDSDIFGYLPDIIRYPHIW